METLLAAVGALFGFGTQWARTGNVLGGQDAGDQLYTGTGGFKDLFFKGTWLGNLFGSQRPKGTYLMQDGTGLFESFSGGVTFGQRENTWVKTLLIVVAAGVVVAVVLAIASFRKRKRR